MSYILGDDRILFIKINGIWTPVACLNSNSFQESSEMMDTTTRDNLGWNTSRPMTQEYSITFTGVQINSTVVGGNFDVASFDKLKSFKRNRILLDWKIEGTVFPIVDYGKCYITSLEESSSSTELLTFSGTLTGFGKPLIADLGGIVLNDGDPNTVINTENYLIKTN
jgi:hypothetical protein